LTDSGLPPPTGTNPQDYGHAAEDKDWSLRSNDSYVQAPFNPPSKNITIGILNNKDYRKSVKAGSVVMLEDISL
jgi:hypothetical protein